jgi:N-dimethylarginine dimethylaminohydrolase
MEYPARKFTTFTCSKDNFQTFCDTISPMILKAKNYAFIDSQNPRINDMLRSEAFNVEEVDYSEPIALCGSFRCTTLPLVRE